MSQESLNQDGGPFNIGDDCDIDGCQYVYDEWQELYFHGYEHYGLEGLDHFARRHRSHILQPYDMTSYNLKVKKQSCPDCIRYPCRSFNFPLQPNIRITEQMIEGYLLNILNTLGTSLKAKVGVSRILMSCAPTPTPVLKFYRCEHDNFTEMEMEGVVGKKLLRTDKANVEEGGLTGLHPYLVDSWGTCQQVAPQVVNDIEDHMLNDGPDSEYMVVAATNIRIYCFLVDMPVGHTQGWGTPRNITSRPYVEDVHPHLDDNLCLFRCILKKLRPLENEENRELRVRLIRIFLTNSFQQTINGLHL